MKQTKKSKEIYQKPVFVPFVSKGDYTEKTSNKPVKTLIPGQALQLSELMSRFERGQRLNVHENFKPGSNLTDGCIIEEEFDDAPPDGVHDVVDVKNFYDAHKQHKQDFAKKQKEKRSAASPAPQTPESPTPPDPAKS